MVEKGRGEGKETRKMHARELTKSIQQRGW